MSGEFVVNTLILFIIFLIILWLAGKIFFAVLFRVLRNKEAAAQKQIPDDDISAEQMLLNLELVKNGVDVRKQYGPEAPHVNAEVDKKLKRIAQRAFEAKYSHTEWMQEFGKNFLDEEDEQ